MRGVPGQHRVDRLALGDVELGAVGEVVGRQLRAADHHGIRAGDGEDRVAVLAGGIVLGTLPDPRDGVGVVEADADDLLHAHGAPDSPHPPHDIRAPIAVRHQVDDLDLAGLGLPAGHQHERVGLVGARGAALRADRGQPPVALLLVAEQGAERRRRIEPRQAQPVDAAVGADERAGVTVADEGVVLDGKGHGPILPHSVVDAAARARCRPVAGRGRCRSG